MTIRSILTLVLVWGLLGCSPLTLDNYNKITMGMTYDDVTRLIGAPEHCDDVMGIRSCQWGDEKRGVNVNFVAGQVLLFSSHNLQ